ncbi:MAG TPA: hypothetical protein VFB63_05550 [Bryobacteraceae bacterium]|nr:hypothetical protein [Bryobacteraceae bacterium]
MSAASPSLDMTREDPARRIWVRWLTPSLSDFFFVAIVTWTFLISPFGWAQLLADGDTGWHIRTGQWIFAEGRFPYTDMFSFSKAGESWFAWEWGSDLWFAFLFDRAGLKGITLFAGAWIALFAWVILRYMVWRGANGILALLISLVAVGASSLHYLARPHIFTLLFVPLSLWIIEADRRKTGNLIWLLVPLTVLWTNLHGGFLALIAFLGLLTVGSAIELAWNSGWNWKEPRVTFAPALRYGLLTLACALATVVNPYGWKLHQHIAAYLNSDWIKSVVQEFQAPTFRGEGLRQYEMLLFAALLVAASMLARRRVVEPLWILFWAHQSLTSARHITLFAALAGPLVACEATRLWNSFRAGAGRKSVRAILHSMSTDLSAGMKWSSVWPLLFIGTLLALQEPIRWPQDFPSQKFPTDLVRKHEVLIRDSRLLTTDQWGDYVLFHYWPAQKVFIDGRSDFYGPKIGNEYLRLSQGGWDWNQLLDRHGFTAALVPLEWPLAALLKQHPGWKVLSDDGKALVFQKIAAKPQSAAASGAVTPGKIWGRH